jgi:HD superfamily phosphohydrolase
MMAACPLLAQSGHSRADRVLEKFRKGFSAEVADLIAAETPADIYASIVSSQFDADRLDYIRRDRMMTGVVHGGFDFSWLMANLEVGPVPLTIDDEVIGEVDALILNPKALQAAESYVLGLFHLYFTVYFHKSTRGAEKMLTALLQRVAQLIRDGTGHLTGLPDNSPLFKFIKSGNLSDYLWLDDTTIWASLHSLIRSKDEIIRLLALRLVCRRLYKGIDVGAVLESRGEAAIARFKMKLRDAKNAGTFGPIDVFEDTVKRNPYQRKALETPGVLSKVLIRRSDGTNFEDLRDCSDVVRALEEKARFRVYFRDLPTRRKVEALLGGV